MDFFDKNGKKASDTYKATAEKTTKIARETKLKMEINVNKANISELYEKIGKKVYEKHRLEQGIDIEKELVQECAQIDVLADQIEDARMEILSLRDKKQCSKCYYEIDLDANYCSNCGLKQENTVEVKKQKEKSENNISIEEIQQEENEEEEETKHTIEVKEIEE